MSAALPHGVHTAPPSEPGLRVQALESLLTEKGLVGKAETDLPTFLDCPEYLNQQDEHRCGLPAEVKRRFIMRSTSGQLESAMIRCPAGHFFYAPIEFLGLERHSGVRRQVSEPDHEHADRPPRGGVS